MKEKYLSIIVPVFNAEVTLKKCLQAILNIKGFTECELIVADDGSTDSSLEIAKKYADKIVRSPKNKGPAFTRNLGAKSASGEFLLFVDSDVVLSSPDILSYLKKGFSRSDICGIVGIYEEETPFNNFFSVYKHLDMCFHEKTYPRFSPGVPSAILAAPRKEFLDHGGFNENFPGVMAEDIEFSVRISTETGKLWLKDERIKGIHFKKYGLFSLLKTDYFRIKGLARVMQKEEYRANYLRSCPSSAFWPLVFAALTAVLLFLSIFYFKFLWLAFGAFLLFFAVKLNFFRYSNKIRNISFALKAVIFSFFEMILAAVFALCWQIIYKFKEA